MTNVVAGHDIRLLFSPLLLLPVAKEELPGEATRGSQTKRAPAEWTLRKHTRAHTRLFSRKRGYLFSFYLLLYDTLSQKTPSIAAITRGCVVKATNNNRKGRTQIITTTFSSLSKNYTMTEIELKPTELVYLKDTYVFRLEDEATDGLRQQQDEGTNVFYEIALDKTIAHPAGGGSLGRRQGVVYTDQNVWFHFDSVNGKETKQVRHRGSFSKDSEEMLLANVRGQKVHD